MSPSPETWSSTRSFWFWEMGLLRWGSLLFFSAAGCNLAADGRNGTEEGVGKGFWTGRRWLSFLWAPLAREQPPCVFKGPLPMLWAVLQPMPRTVLRLMTSLAAAGNDVRSLGPGNCTPRPLPWQPLPPTHDSTCPPPHLSAPHSPEKGESRRVGEGWEGGRIEPMHSGATGKRREGLIYTFRTTQHHRTLQKEGEIPLCICMVVLDSLFWLTLWLHYNSGLFKYTAIITKITGLLWLYFSLVN